MDQAIDNNSDNQPDNNYPIYDTTNKGIPLEALLDYRSKGLSYADIAKLVGCSKANVVQRLSDYKEELESLDSFKNNRADYFAIQQSRLLNSITKDEIKSMPVGSRITGAAILYDKERLERNLSTDNIAIDQVVQERQEAEANIAEARAKLAALRAEAKGQKP